MARGLPCPVRTVVLVLAVGLALVGTARAQDTWSDPYPGVRRLSRRLSTPNDVDALVIDLCASGVSLRATASGERRQTVPSWASASGVEVATNGDFFSYEDYSTSGLAVHDAMQWRDSPDTTGSGAIAFGHDRAFLSRPREVLSPIPGWLRESVGGHPLILADGAVVSDTSSLCTARHPRTAVGLSRDGRTLYLVVVDGRSSRSVGMTCAELARQLDGLGAWIGLNLDGGGSSTMWVRGTGTVNSPSDGAPRTVANHLGVNATGSGMPGSCVALDDEEAVYMAGILDESSTSDLDGDGRADVCARAGAGIQCHLATGTAFGDVISGPAWSDMSGWSDEDNWSTIRMGDVNGDGLADLCGRSNADYRCAVSTGTGFGATFVTTDLGNAAGFDQPDKFGTIRLADFDGDGDDDVCARDASGFHCWPSTGTAFGARVSLAELSDANGWDRLDRWGSIRMGDVDGDGRADVCARGSAGFDCWRSLGDSFATTPIAGPRWSDMGGWTAHRFWSTIRLADLDGDFMADVCGRSGSDFRCHLSSGDGFGAAVTGPALSDENGWNELDNYSTLRLADIDGDGDRDLCGRGNDGVRCWKWNGDAFAGSAIMGPGLSNEGSWDYANYHRSIRVGDVNGDGRADICGRGYSRLHCWLSDGTGFPTRIDGPGWSNAGNWWRARYHATIRIAGPPVMRPVEPPPDAGTPPSDEDAGTPPPDVDAGDPGAEIDAGPGTPRRDSGTATPPSMRPSAMEGGCGCHVPLAPPRTSTIPVVAGAVIALVLLRGRRRRARRPADCD